MRLRNQINSIIIFILIFFLSSTTVLAKTTGSSLISTTKIGQGTTNGPTLTGAESYGYGYSLIGDLNADGIPDIAVGSTGSPNGGAVFIHYMNRDGSIISTVQIGQGTPNGPVLVANDTYGYEVTDIGDLNNDGVQDLAVGSYGNDMGGAANTNRGAIFIHYMNRDGSIISTVKIGQGTANGPTLALNDHYGSAVTSIGDLDNDGIQDLAVGAPYDETGGTDRGAFYIHYMNRNGSIKSTVKITGSTANGAGIIANSQLYGRGITGLGDLDLDGIPDIAVGSYASSSVYIHYMNRNGTIKSTVKNTAGTAFPETGPAYGFGLDSLGDIDGDSITDIVVGAYGDSTGGGANRGAAFVQTLNRNGSIKTSSKITSVTTNGPTLIDAGYYGLGVSGVGDINGDGAIDIGVAEPFDNGGKGSIFIHFLNPLPGISVTDLATSQFPSSLSVTEGEVGKSLNVSLDSKPAQNVTVTISITSNEVSLSTNSLVFDSTNWDEPQILTITAIDDSDTEVAHNDTLTFAVTSSDASYNVMSVPSIPITVIDDDTPSVINSKSSLSVAEGNNGTFALSLNSQPQNDVTINLTLSTNQATIDTSSVTFTSTNWNIEQVITLTPVNDSSTESSLNGTISFIVVTTDTIYNGMSVPNLSITILDNDSPGLTPSVTPLIVPEGQNAPVSFVLNTQPTSPVTVTLGVTPMSVSSNASTLTFTSSNWNIPQSTTITATNNDVANGTTSGSLSFVFSSDDSTYNGLVVSVLPLSITDSDSINFIFSKSAVVVSEGGSGDVVHVNLSSQPSSDVTLNLTHSGHQTSVSTNSLTFTPSNWNVPQAITITPIDDKSIEYNQIDEVAFTSVSADSSYNSLTLPKLTITITDNDSPQTRIAGTFPRKLLGQQKITEVAQSSSSITFKTILSLGSRNDQVKELQKFLNDRGFIVSYSGAGSPGNETNFFGTATKKALVEFEKTYMIEPSLGILKSKTMDAVNSLVE